MQNRFNTYFTVAQKLITQYKGEMPLAIYLKNYFGQNKKHGSTDRKQIAHWCYCYYRLGNAFTNIDGVERMKIAFYLCNNEPTNYSSLYQENWLHNWSKNIDERIQFIHETHNEFLLEDLFKTHTNIAVELNKNEFIKSHLQQPNLFLRLRPTYEKIVKEKLKKSNVLFAEVRENCLALTNGIKIENIIEINKEAVVQDDSSQQVASLIEVVKANLQQPFNVWDCCAASGGKSILAIDVLQNINLTVSDIRASIIANLKTRFAIAGIKNYQSFVADISKSIHQNTTYNFIICDAPCTGSGTWSRTPEELFFFKEESIKKFAILQFEIAKNSLQHLQVGGYFLYITCSVFAQENDEIVNGLLQQFNLELIEKKYFIGYINQADTMFAALLKKNN